MEKKSIKWKDVNPIFWRSASDFSYDLNVMICSCPDEEFREILIKAHENISSLYKKFLDSLESNENGK